MKPNTGDFSQATPRPWKMEASHDVNSTAFDILGADGDWIATVHGGREFDEKDAALIVRAVNRDHAFEGLLELLKGHVSGHAVDCQCLTHKAITEAEAHK